MTFIYFADILYTAPWRHFWTLGAIRHMERLETISLKEAAWNVPFPKSAKDKTLPLDVTVCLKKVIRSLLLDEYQTVGVFKHHTAGRIYEPGSGTQAADLHYKLALCISIELANCFKSLRTWSPKENKITSRKYQCCCVFIYNHLKLSCRQVTLKYIELIDSLSCFHFQCWIKKIKGLVLRILIWLWHLLRYVTCAYAYEQTGGPEALLGGKRPGALAQSRISVGEVR